MSDTNGAALSPGDQAAWHGPNQRADVVPVTVLRETSPNRYLIRINRRSDALRTINVAGVLEENMLDHGFARGDALETAERFKEVDPQAPVEVDGTELEPWQP